MSVVPVASRAEIMACYKRLMSDEMAASQDFSLQQHALIIVGGRNRLSVKPWAESLSYLGTASWNNVSRTMLAMKSSTS